jgi:hypothetical protein
LTAIGSAWAPRSSVSSASASGTPRSEQLRAGRVCQVLALPRDRKLEQHCSDRSDDDRQQRPDEPDRAGVLVVSAEQKRELQDVRDRGDRARHHGRDRRHEDVAVLDVRELVGEHTPHLLRRQVLQQALGDGDSGVLRVAPGRKCVGLLGRDRVEARHGYAGAAR